MLDKLRDSSRSFGMYLVFGVLILVFVIYFGPGSSGCTGGPAARSEPFAATVNGKKISWREFETAYGNMVRAYQQQMGEQFNPEMLEQMGLRNNVLDGLIDRALLIDEARLQGLAVSDAEVAKQLREITAFHKDGHFDFATYRDVLRSALDLSPDRFEAQLRDDLLREKMVAQIRLGAKVSDDELRAEFERENDRANLTFVRFAPSQFRGRVEISDEQVAAYLASEEGKKAVADEYDSKAFRFRTPKRVQAQHILVKVEEDAPTSEVDAATAKLEEAKAEIEAGADFGELARKLSDDPGSKEKGGDLGFFGPGAMAKPFEEAAMALEVGELSSIVRTRFGLHLIKVNDVQEATEKELEEVQDELARELLVEVNAKALARARADEAHEAVQEGAKLVDLYGAAPEDLDPAAAQEKDGPVAFSEESGRFGVNSEYIPRLGSSAAIAKASAAAKKGQLLPEVYELNGDFVVAVVKDRDEPDLSKFDGQKERIRGRVLRQKEAELVEAYTKNLRGQATIVSSKEFGTSERS